MNNPGNQPSLRNVAIAISVSNSADLEFLGLSPAHLTDAMAEIARHLLALGARLVYGGDLRTNGFTELLFELALRYTKDGDSDDRPAVLNYLPWPVHMSLTNNELAEREEFLGRTASIICLDRAGRPMDRAGHLARLPAKGDWDVGLTSMRRAVTEATDGRVVMGGALKGFRGSMPGIAEEVLWSFRCRKPIFILGGFGGCAKEVARTSDLLPSAKERLQFVDQFEGFGVGAIDNGLSAEENRTLARTVHVEEMVILILRGLLQKFSP